MKTGDIILGSCMAVAAIVILGSLVLPPWRHRVPQWRGGAPMSLFSRIMFFLFPALLALLVLRVLPSPFALLVFVVGIAGFIGQIVDSRRYRRR